MTGLSIAILARPSVPGIGGLLLPPPAAHGHGV